jgi:translation initiation factor 2-alpha kinase 4
MSPSSPWGKKPQLNTSASGFPGLTPTTATATVFASPGSQYDEIQKDEVFALSSIYGEDFQQIETTGAAWKVIQLYFEEPVSCPMSAKSIC